MTRFSEYLGWDGVATLLFCVGNSLPYVMSTKFSDFLTSSPLSAFGSDFYNKIHATALTTSAFP